MAGILPFHLILHFGLGLVTANFAAMNPYFSNVNLAAMMNSNGINIPPQNAFGRAHTTTTAKRHLPQLNPNQMSALAQFWTALQSKSPGGKATPKLQSTTTTTTTTATKPSLPKLPIVPTVPNVANLANANEVEALPGLSQFLASLGSSPKFQNLKTDPLNIYSMAGHPLFQNPAGCPPGCIHSECTFLGCPRCRKGLYLYNYNRIYICVNQCPDGFKTTDGACTTGKPVLVGYTGDKKDLKDVYFPLSDTQQKWRPDGRCGPDHPVPGTNAPSQCEPSGEDPCCSVHGWCGRTREHCTCVGCKDYSGKIGKFFKGDGGWTDKSKTSPKPVIAPGTKDAAMAAAKNTI